MSEPVTHILNTCESSLAVLSQRVERLKDEVEQLTVWYRLCDERIGQDEYNAAHKYAG